MAVLCLIIIIFLTAKLSGDLDMKISLGIYLELNAGMVPKTNILGHENIRSKILLWWGL